MRRYALPLAWIAVVAVCVLAFLGMRPAGIEGPMWPILAVAAIALVAIGVMLHKLNGQAKEVERCQRLAAALSADRRGRLVCDRSGAGVFRNAHGADVFDRPEDPCASLAGQGGRR